MSLWITGRCSMCGASQVDVRTVDGAALVCESCLDSFYFQCDKCGELWLDDPDVRVETDDGQTLCPWCAED